MQNNSLNLADAEPQTNYGVIPDGTLAKVRLHIKRGGYNDETKGWTDGFATRSNKTGAVYLDGEFTVIEGKYTNRKIWSLIGLHSDKGDKYRQMGRSFMRGICDSANRLDPKDKTSTTNNIRNNLTFADLDGVEFVAKIEVEKDNNGNDKNIIRYAITKGHPDYDDLIGKKPKDNGRFKIGGDKKAETTSDIVDDELPF